MSNRQQMRRPPIIPAEFCIRVPILPLLDDRIQITGRLVFVLMWMLENGAKPYGRDVPDGAVLSRLTKLNYEKLGQVLRHLEKHGLVRIIDLRTEPPKFALLNLDQKYGPDEKFGGGLDPSLMKTLKRAKMEKAVGRIEKMDKDLRDYKRNSQFWNDEDFEWFSSE